MKKTIRILVPLLLVVLIIASIGWYLFVYDRDFTRDVLLSQARFHDTQGNPKLASWFYDLAYEHTGQDANVAIELANQYKADGNYTKAEFTLTNAIADSGGTIELYTALSKTYVEQDKLLDAVNMLDKVTNAKIREQLTTLRPAAPTSNPEPGFYSQYIGVTLTSDPGILYYNTQGDYPSTLDPVYSHPITLPAGETSIQAVCVSDNGLVSPLATLDYTVGGVIELVKFKDPVVEASIRQILHKDSDDEIYTDELWTITEFTLPEDADVFDDLAGLTYLQKLTIQEKRLDNLQFLSGMTRLQELDLTGCRFSPDQLSTVAALPQLKKLTLASCGLSTISALSGAQSLKYLDLHSNTLRNLEVLAPMTTLEEIDLTQNAVVELTHLSGLTGLKKLNISYNSVTALDPLASCASLTWLNADNNALESLAAVDQFSTLSYLSVAHNKLSDVAILESCVSLTELNISNNSISDIGKLHPLVHLEVFNFSYNQVKALPQWSEECVLRTIDGSYNELTSIDGLAKLSELTYVYMDYNKLTNVNALVKCYHLVQLNVYGNSIKDVSVLLKDAEGNDRGVIVNYDPTAG